MRPPRIAILGFFLAASLFLFCRSVGALLRTAPVLAPAAVPKSRFTSFFAFNAPFTLFPPNAAISLTDDNSTSFAARPAAFGPPLPSKGLSGQLWVGSGFAEDNLQEGEGEGELGCSDIPGWEDGNTNILKSSAKTASKANAKSAPAAGSSRHPKRDIGPKGTAVHRTSASDPVAAAKDRTVDDGTDDYLHQPLGRPQKSGHDTKTASGSGHADIQSIQEGAEIAGKIVLLSRGGCGFLEKVKWAQRRGAVALIVGDNQKGGPLIQMFARGDTSNITIPSVFTARTTAHLLSSLTQPGSFIEDTIDENGRPTLKVQQSDKNHKNRKSKGAAATKAAPAKPASTTKATPKKRAAVEEKTAPAVNRSSWLSRLFSWGGSKTSATESSRPPSSGHLDWVLVDDWSDEKDKVIRDSLDKAKKSTDGSSKAGSRQSSEDSFLIGVHDWRDPDLLPGKKGDSTSSSSKGSAAGVEKGQTSNPGAPSKSSGKKTSEHANGLSGGSITPGSGEYAAGAAAKSAPGPPAGSASDASSQSGVMSKMFGDDDATSNRAESTNAVSSSIQDEEPLGDSLEPEGHDGLWVTITPSSSASTFFDTLLVLIISPLITLTVVYAMLILRARIRRRRWRAPKSVVERLPVRTYHTVAASPSLSPRLPSPTSSSPTTPLLQQTPSRPRPRSRTTTGVPESNNLLTVEAALAMPRSPSRSEHEKGFSSEWKKYMGRQVECVVCLEEYVDGVSRVMSLPCGHEFHVECM